jgi:hypothetical protein
MENRYRKPAGEPRKGWFKGKRIFRPVSVNLGDYAPSTSNASKKETRKGFRPIAAVSSLLDGSILTHKWIVNNIPYLIFMALLAIFYISNSATAERNRSAAGKLEEELKELRYKYISTKSSVMYLSNPSQISNRLKETGIRENVVPPVKIFVTPEETRP